MAVGGRLVLNQGAIDAIARSDGIRRLQTRNAELVTQEAKRLAPVSPHGSNGRPSGWLRSHVGWELVDDPRGIIARIHGDAYSPEGFNYGIANEIGTRKMAAQPFLRPSVDVLRHS